ncbi:uncharacterized protein LOC134460938 [Engraulis encrasicolus]|uniref:uncharacterized protein LOC134460938 n=1 Tax=Engraulis encrasicolus TaxID=184585 RepID=UPI002FD030D9
MTSQHTPLLRRPLPPKELPPLKPPPSPLLSGPALQKEVYESERAAVGGASGCCSPVASWECCMPQPTPLPSPCQQHGMPLPSSSPSPCQQHGMPSLPPGRLRRHTTTLPRMQHLLHGPSEHLRYAPAPPLFLLNSFLLPVPGPDQSQLPLLARRRVLGRRWVEQLLVGLHSAGQTQVTNQLLSSEEIIPPAQQSRVPRRQMLCELQALLHLRSLRSVCECNKPSPEEKEEDVENTTVHTHTHHSTPYPGNEVMLNAVTTKHFQGVRRTHSPFEPAGGWGGITPSQLAILHTHTHASTHLSLKAHFISQLPDVSLLADTLQYLNLSFNTLTELPLEVCSLHGLQHLKMRSNPLSRLPSEIQTLRSLRTLTLSFCKLEELPTELYSLPCLQHLDVSYNLLTALSSDIRNLKSLRQLNVEGNQMFGLPAGVMSLSLWQLQMDLNYTHPALWRLHTHTPQRLQDIAAHTLTHALTHTHTHLQTDTLPPHAQHSLSRVRMCDCCGGPRFGEEVCVLRCCSELFGVAMVPLLFHSCSPACLCSFKTHNTNIMYTHTVDTHT